MRSGYLQPDLSGEFRFWMTCVLSPDPDPISLNPSLRYDP